MQKSACAASESRCWAPDRIANPARKLTEDNMNISKKTISVIVTATFAGLVIALGIFCPAPLRGQSNPPKYEIDPYWPKPLPNGWVNGWIGGVCVDARDHVFIVDRRNLTDNEKEAGHPAPPVIEFDSDGNVVNSWGDPDTVPIWQHGCYVDYENNVWLTGATAIFTSLMAMATAAWPCLIAMESICASGVGRVRRPKLRPARPVRSY